MSPHYWNEVRRIADDVALQIHLGEMETRDRWQALEPKLVALEHRLVRAGHELDEVLRHDAQEVHDELIHIRDSIYARTRSSFVKGW